MKIVYELHITIKQDDPIPGRYAVIASIDEGNRPVKQNIIHCKKEDCPDALEQTMNWGIENMAHWTEPS